MNPMFTDSSATVTAVEYFLPCGIDHDRVLTVVQAVELELAEEVGAPRGQHRGVVAVGHPGSGETARDATLFGVQGHGRALEAVPVDHTPAVMKFLVNL